MNWEVKTMLSKRSSCDLALRRADWRRFWPLLFLYAAVWLMALPMGIWNRRWSIINADTLQDALRRVESTIYDCVTASVVISAIFAVLLAMTLFGYLMSSRSVGLMHSLPVNRTKQFFNHFLVGVEIFTLVHILTVVVSVLVMSSCHGVIAWEGILTWFAVAELTSLFFFSLATLCAMVTGWVIAIPVIYVGVNAMFVAFYALLQLMFDLFYWGYSDSGFPVFISWLTPFERLLRMANNCYNYDHELNQASYHMSNDGWSALIVYTVVAVVFIVVAWLFYKGRRSESAGDAIVFDWLRPIVLYVMSVVGGMGFGFLLFYLVLDGADTLLGLLICQIIAGIVVYFAVQMLLNKSFKVFNRRGWLGAALLAVMLIVISAVVKFDLLGYERFVPEEDKVVSVDFSGSTMADYIYTEDAERIAKITAIHRAILAQGETEVWEYEEIPNAVSCHFSIDYDLTNGTRVRRNYNLLVEKGSELHQAMNEFMNLEGVYADSFFRNYDAARTDTIVGGYYHNYRDEYYDKYYYEDVTIDAETDMVITESYAPVKEVQLTAEQATALYEAVGQHIQRKSRENIGALATGYSDFVGSTTYQIEIHFSEPLNQPTDVPVDTGYLDAWYISSIPADCTEVMDLIIDFGFANNYDELLYGRYN